MKIIYLSIHLSFKIIYKSIRTTIEIKIPFVYLRIAQCCSSNSIQFVKEPRSQFTQFGEELFKSIVNRENNASIGRVQLRNADQNSLERRRGVSLMPRLIPP